MKATDWEFRNRALIFGLIFAFTFPLYALDHQNATAVVAEWLGIRVGLGADLLARLLFDCAAFLLIVAAFIRTWASAYLRAGVVYAAALTIDPLVADGPYRFVRNPLYLANVLMAVQPGGHDEPDWVRRGGCGENVDWHLRCCRRRLRRLAARLG
jgi:protein-S-isoprenylcysteine O-methyltransferase Ste14